MREMTRETRDKLTRYLVNSDPFLWGTLSARNKKGRILELKSMGFLSDYPDNSNAIYSRINHDLLVQAGIEAVLERIVAPRIRTLFPADTLQYLRRCWEQGQTPTLDYFKQQGLYKRRYLARETFEGPLHIDTPPSGYRDPAFIFVQIDTQYNYVLRWTVFAGLWFEEIEPLVSA